MILSIIPVYKPFLYTIGYLNGQGEEVNAYEEIRQNWQDTEYLQGFFELKKHKRILGQAYWVARNWQSFREEVPAHAHRFNELLLFQCSLMEEDSARTLDELFVPYDNNEDAGNRYTGQRSKLRNDDFPHWLRWYAIRLSPRSYILTGGAIKVVRKTEQQAALIVEERKMDQTIGYLKGNRIIK